MGTHSLPEMVVGVVLLTLLVSTMALSNELEEEEDEQMIDPRQVRFSFGLGKRSAPALRPDVARLLATIKAWGYSGPHGLFKRGKDLTNDDPNDVARLLANIKAWGYSGPHGLFKRGKDLNDQDPDEEINQLLEEVGERLMQMGRKSKRISDDEMGKRQPYGFGLGKRAPAPSYDFGLGKRDLDNYDPEPVRMKRQVQPSWLRKRFAFGLGKRAPYGFGLGK